MDYYISKGVDVEIADFRGVKSAYEHGLLHSEINNASSGIVVNLAENSSFSNLSENELKRLRITNYKKDILLEHHNSSVHEYSISEYVLSADVIINIPKPKSHRIAGFTAALKNFVGANTRKEFLPHHTLGTPQNGGDESDVGGMLMRVRVHCLDKKNDYEYSHRYLLAKLNVLLVRIFSYLTRIQRSSYREGCWYGNRTISKTIRDINKIVYYSDKNGVIHENIQRTVLSIADMIIAGEGEGPMAPSDKYVGMIVAGFNPVNVDRTIAAIMGFDEKKVPFLADMLGMPQEKWIIKTNIIENGSINIEQAKEVLNQHFLATSGWKNHIELQSV